MSKHTTVMDIFGTTWYGWWVFRQKPDDGLRDTAKVYMPDDKWREMGRPKVITVTIEVGDLLNTERHPWA